MQHLIWIGIAGAGGACARYGVTIAAQRLTGLGFPWGTFAVNALGSIALGFLVEASVRAGWSTELKLAVGTGFLGAFTTFSTFSVETARLIEAGRWDLAAANALGSVAVGLAGAFLGFALAHRV